MDNKHLINIDLDNMKTRIERLMKFVDEGENDIYDWKKIEKEYKNNIDLKVLLLEKAKKSLMQDLEYMRKLANVKQDLDPELSKIVNAILTFGQEGKSSLIQWLQQRQAKIKSFNIEEDD